MNSSMSSKGRYSAIATILFDVDEIFDVDVVVITGLVSRGEQG